MTGKIFSITGLIISCIVYVGCTEPVNHHSGNKDPVKIESQAENRMPGEYIVTLKDGGNLEVIQKAFSELGIESLQGLSNRRVLMKLKDDPGPEQVEKLGTAATGIESVQPNYIYKQQDQPANNKTNPFSLEKK